MSRKRTRLGVLVIGVLSICVIVGSMAGAADAKKKKKGSSTINLSKAVNQVVPPEVTGTVDKDGAVVSQIVVGKKFKGRQIGDVNATVSYTSSDPAGIDDLFIYLTAPNGATSELVTGGPGNSTTFGPLTLDDESPLFVCGGNTNPGDNQEPYCVYPPYVGKSEPSYIPLSVMDGGPAKGTWTLSVYNGSSSATSIKTFGSWSIQVATHKPFLEQ